MPDVNAGIYSPADAKMILETIRELKAGGWVRPGGSTLQGVNRSRPIHVISESTEPIPAWSFMQTSDTQEFGPQNFLKVNKFDEDVFGSLLINGPRQIEPKGLGVAQDGPMYRIKFVDPDPDTPIPGHLYGPVADEWLAEPNGGPYKLLGLDDVADHLGWFELDPARVYIGIVTKEITAADGDVLGNGEVTLKPIGGEWTLANEDLQEEIAVGSILSAAHEVDARMIVSRSTNGKLVVIAEDCDA